MIYCPQCGTANKPNSKFCKNCAALLAPSTDVRCPICGTMNPSGAPTCANCGTRLSTTSAAVSDRTTPADTPENITPFTPPELPQAENEDESAPPASPAASRPLFNRSSSEWLRRVQKTPPPEAPASNAAAASAAALVAAASGTDATNLTAPQSLAQAPARVEEEDIPDWLREIQNKADRQAAAQSAAESVALAQDSVPAPTKPQLSEIKLTGDDYDYSDIGGEVTDEMKAQLEAQAGGVQTMDDEIALARKLLGLDVDEAPAAATEPQAPPLVPLAASVVAARTLSGEEPRAEIETPAAETGAMAVEEPPQAPAAQMASPDAIQPISSEATLAPDKDGISPAGAIAGAVAVGAAAAKLTDKEDDVTAGELIEPQATAPAEVTLVTSDETRASVPAEATNETSAAGAIMITEGTESAAPTLETGEVPEWLREMAPEQEASATLPSADEDELPQWVQELAPAGAALGTVAYLSELPELDQAERDELPEWLREPVAPMSEAATEPGSGDQAESQTPPVELPSWFSDPAVTGPTKDPFEVVEMTGPLAGISGILPLALAITEPHMLATPTPARSEGGRVFQLLLAEPLASAARVETADKRKGLFTVNHLLYLLILLAALVPLFFGLEQAGLGLNAATSGTALFYDELESVPANGNALLAFEYTPGGAVELDAAARAIVNDLAARRVNVIALASNPNGATLAQNILQRTREEFPEFTFVNVGYIPGNEAGLRALASGWLSAGRQDVNGVAWGSTPLAGAVRNMDELALTVLIAGDDAALRAWMEQVEPRVSSPIIAATSAQLEPQARNYVNADQLQASLRGLTGAAELELLSNQTGPAVKTMDAFSVVSLVVAGIIIVANVMLLARRKK